MEHSFSLMNKWLAFLVTFLLVRQLWSFHLNIREHETKSDLPLLKWFQISYMNQSSGQFPLAFNLRFSQLDENISVEFNLIRKPDRVDSNDIYVLDDRTGEPVRYDLDDDHEKYQHYKQKDGFGVATLIENRGSRTNPFRIIVSFDKDEESFEIYPANVVKPNDENSPRLSVYNTDYNYHVIKTPTTAQDEPMKASYSSSFLRPDDFAIKENLLKKAKNIYRRTKERLIEETNGDYETERSGPIELFVEFLLVTDITVFNHHKDLLGVDDPQKVLTHMRTYFSHIINGVNERFKVSLQNDSHLRIDIVLKNFLFLTNLWDCEWSNHSDQVYKTYDNKPVILATQTLEAFAEFMNSKKFPFEFDHASGFFYKDLWNEEFSESPANRKSVVGFAYLDNICTEFKYSVVEDVGGFSNNINALAHEIGHNLGLRHDGSELNPCLASENYIMTSSNSFHNIVNSFRFSPCSISELKSFLLNDDLNEPSKAAECLINKPIVWQLDKKYVYAGQIWSPHDQCRLAFGKNASFCLTEHSSMCTTLYCRRSPSSECVTFPGGSADGTVCAPGKVCIRGICQSSPLAPKSSCPFGDDYVPQKLLKISMSSAKMTCQQVFELIRANNQSISAYCSHDYFNKFCCQSCMKYRALKCYDKDINCPMYRSICSTGMFMDGQLVRNLCPRTCGLCKTNKSQCDSNICMNGGVCRNAPIIRDGLFEFECQCLAGYTGELCETKTPCLPNPCQNQGVCIPLGSLAYSCQCRPYCWGENCSFCQTTSTALITTITSTVTTSTTTLQTTTQSSRTSSTQTTKTTSSTSTSVRSTTVSTTVKLSEYAQASTKLYPRTRRRHGKKSTTPVRKTWSTSLIKFEHSTSRSSSGYQTYSSHTSDRFKFTQVFYFKANKTKLMPNSFFVHNMSSGEKKESSSSMRLEKLTSMPPSSETTTTVKKSTSSRSTSLSTELSTSPSTSVNQYYSVSPKTGSDQLVVIGVNKTAVNLGHMDTKIRSFFSNFLTILYDAFN